MTRKEKTSEGSRFDCINSGGYRHFELGPCRLGALRFGAAVFGLHFGQVSVLSAIVNVLVGLAGLYQLVTWKPRLVRGFSTSTGRFLPASTRRPPCTKPKPSV